MSLGELLWNMGSSRGIIAKAHERFGNPPTTPAAMVGLASAYYSIAKPWRSLWSWRQHHKVAGRLAWQAYNASQMGAGLTADQIDVVTRVLVTGSYSEPVMLAVRNLIDYALTRHPEARTMKPHTRAQLRLSLGRFHFLVKSKAAAHACYDAADELLSAISTENASDRERQWARVAREVALFRLDHCPADERPKAVRLLKAALRSARRVSKSEMWNIRISAWQRGVFVW